MSRNPSTLQKLENQNLQNILSEQIQKCSRHHTRQCPELPDMTFIMACLKRVITQHKSGRDFLQFLHDVEGQEIKSSTFFEAFKSQRRLHTVRESSFLYHDLLSKLLTSAGVDHLSQFPELTGYEVFSADGHFIKHSSHLKKKQGSNKIYAAGNIYAQNIRNGLLQLLTPVTDGSAKKHELPHFKNAIEILNFSKKIIWVLDRAYMDYRWWEKQKAMKRNIISRAKSNMSVLYCGDLSFNPHDLVNAGVVSDRLGGFSTTASTIRIIEYINPEDGEEFTFYTTLPSNIRPGVICWLYFLRWKIEKAFDCFKNDLGEKKAWGTGTTPLQIQGYSICIIYNFIHFLSETIQKTHDCKDNKSERKYRDNLKKRETIAKSQGHFIHPLIFLSRTITKISAQVIRVVRNHFFHNKPLRLIIPLFIQRLEAYL